MINNTIKLTYKGQVFTIIILFLSNNIYHYSFKLPLYIYCQYGEDSIPLNVFTQNLV